MRYDFKKLVDTLLDYSTKIQKGEKVLVHLLGVEGMPLAEALFEGIRQRGALPFYEVTPTNLLVQQQQVEDEQLFKIQGEAEKVRMEKMDAFIGIRTQPNIYWEAEATKVGSQLYNKHLFTPVHGDIRVPKTKWVILKYPTEGLAQDAGMSLKQYTDYWWEASTADYASWSEKIEPLFKRMNEGKHVHIKGPDMDFEMSIDGIPAVPCVGSHNIPDGEVFTAPVMGSMTGTYYNPSPNFYDGSWYEGIRLTFKDGMIDEVDCEKGPVEKLKAIFYENEGGRVVGEFAIGFNPFIKTPTSDILFTEKMFGFHMAFGRAYEDADNGNRSTIHWDIIYPMNPEDGMEHSIEIDGEVVMKNGRFVPEDLKPLNP